VLSPYAVVVCAKKYNNYYYNGFHNLRMMFSGYRVLLVGFDGFLTKAVDELSGQVPGGKATGRWISGKNRQYLFYDLGGWEDRDRDERSVVCGVVCALFVEPLVVLVWSFLYSVPS